VANQAPREEEAVSTFELAQNALKRFGVYNRLKASVLYDLYWTIADRRIVDERQAQLNFYRELLQGFRPGDLIFDIGANQGVKSEIFLKMGARVVAADPDEANERVLREKFLKLRLRPRPVVVVPKAIGDSESVTTMWIDAPGSTMNTLNPKWVETLRHDQARFGSSLQFSSTKEIPTTTLERLMQIHGVPFFVKIDVEGFEAVVLRGLQRRVPYLSFEVNLPEFKPEGLECVTRLGAVAADGEFNYSVDCRRGLALPAWVPMPAFANVLDTCADRSIEVFWRTRAA
jgi:FkbM family methyltransferase